MSNNVDLHNTERETRIALLAAIKDALDKPHNASTLQTLADAYNKVASTREPQPEHDGGFTGIGSV